MAHPSDHHPPIAAPLRDVRTARLDLRRFQADDLDELATVFAKREVWQYPYDRGFTRKETERFLATQIDEWETCGFGCWIARQSASNRVIGYVGISVPMFYPEILPAVEVGWRFDPEVWGRGFATEGARAALDESFTTLELEEVCSIPQADNPSSGRVCQRLGMRLDREITIPANEMRGALIAQLYRISRAEWFAARIEPGADGGA